MRFNYLSVTNEHVFFPDVLLEQLTVGRGEFSCLLQVPVEAFSSHTLLAPISKFGAKIEFYDKLNVYTEGYIVLYSFHQTLWQYTLLTFLIM
jgi:hypothetical protein